MIIDTRQPPKYQIDYPVLAWMIVIHALALLAPWTYTPGALLSFLVLYYVSACLGITLGYHRLLTHRSLKVPLMLKRFLATCGVLALQGSPLDWVAHHRMHHNGADTAGDPHNARQGFWHSHIGWLLKRNQMFDGKDCIHKFGRDVLADPYLKWLSQYKVMIAFQVFLGIALLALGGVGYVVWGICLRLVAVYHATWLVNSAAHRWGYRSYPMKELATNNWFVGLVAFGEGWHNNHHFQPEAVHVQHRWWEVDITWQTIRILQKLGLAYDLKMPK